MIGTYTFFRAIVAPCCRRLCWPAVSLPLLIRSFRIALLTRCITTSRHFTRLNSHSGRCTHADWYQDGNFVYLAAKTRDADRTRLRKKSLRKAISNPHPDHPCPGACPPSCSWTASRAFVEIVFVRESSRSPLRLVYSGRGIRGYI